MSARKKQAIQNVSHAEKSMPAPQAQTAPVNAALMEETMVWVCTILCSFLVLFVAAFIIRSLYHPDISALIANAQRELIVPGAVRPEPVESLLTRAGIVILGLCLPGFYMFFSRSNALRSMAKGQVFNVITCLCAVAIVVLLYADFSAQNPFSVHGPEHPQNDRDAVGVSNFDFFFEGLFLGNNLLPYTVVFVPLVCALFFIGFRKNGWDSKPGYNKLVNIVGYAISAAVILAIVGMNTFLFPYTAENRYDFEAVYYSMTQVYAGSPMLVDGFTNTYGLYPHFLNPLFQMIGLSVLKFSAVMAVLVALSFLFNFYVLQRFVANKLILFLGFMTVIFFPYLDSRLVTAFDPFFALFPIRYIIPSSLLFMATIYLQNRYRWLYWVTTAAMAASILWNPELGLVSFISWIAVNIYADFYDADGKIALRNLLLHVAYGVGTVAVVFSVYAGIIYLFYGVAPQLSLLFSTMTVFARLGFNLLPMVPVHPWNLMVLVLVFGFLYSVSKLFKKAVSPKASVIFLVSVIGVGFFIYFQGRSHNWSFASISGFSIMLLTLLCDELWEKARTNNLPAFNMLFAIFLFVISFSVVEVVANAATINKLVFSDEDKMASQKAQDVIESNAAFINRNTVEKEKILLLTTMAYHGLYYDGSKRVSAFNPSFTELFFSAGLRRLEETIKHGPEKLFIEAYECQYRYMLPAMLALGATYEVQTSNANIAMLTRRTRKIPGKTFFNRPGRTVQHSKYTGDSVGIEARIHDAVGAAPVTPDSVFSVEVLFYSNYQLCPTAAIVTNSHDSTGFIMERRSASGHYYFGLNGRGMEWELPEKQWAYCVVNVYTDHVDLFTNGVKKGTMPIVKPYRQSKENLRIGSQDFVSVAYYVGPISEVSVANGVLGEAEIAAKWAEITGNIHN